MMLQIVLDKIKSDNLILDISRKRSEQRINYQPAMKSFDVFVGICEILSQVLNIRVPIACRETSKEKSADRENKLTAF